MVSRANNGGWKDEEDPSLTSFKSMLDIESEWYSIANPNPNPTTNFTPLLDNPFLMTSKPSILGPHHSLDFSTPGFFPDGVLAGGFPQFTTPAQNQQMGTLEFGSNSQFNPAQVHQFGSGSGSGDGSGSGNSLFMSRMLQPLENCPPIGSQPTLYQKRAALKRNFSNTENNNVGLGENLSINGSQFDYDSDDITETNNDGGEVRNGGTNSNSNGNSKEGKKKGLPAKNLMAERRRRKKLNDRLYMLRSVVPNISKMDRASILGDAIDYLRELIKKISDLNNEMESMPPASSLTQQTTSFHPLTPTFPNIPSRIKEELCPSSLPSPNGQPGRIEVRLREGRAVNIHMFCGRRQGLLLATMRALDGLGLDIQQAVISCFNGFAMDVFRAEQCKDGQDVHPEQIKALLSDLAMFHGSPTAGNCNL